MTDFNLNLSSSQYDKLKKALESLGDKELDSSKFTGDVDSIFDSLNSEYNNAFKDTGMQEILLSLAGNDKNISENELRALIQMDGKDSFTIEDFEEYASKAIDKSNNNSSTEKVKKSITQDGSELEVRYNSDGTKKSQFKKCKDNTSISAEFIYDDKGNKIGSITKRYDENGNLQSTTETKYDSEGRKIYGKTTDGKGELIGEGTYEYQENEDGTISQLRRNMDGELTNTVIYKDDIHHPISQTNNLTNSVETFEHKTDGTMTSVVMSSNGNKEEENSYDETGNIICKAIFNENGEKIAEIKYTYYDNGELKDKKVTTFKTTTIEEQKAISNTPTIATEPIKTTDNNTKSGKLGQDIVNSAKKYIGFNEADGTYKKFGYAGHWCAAFVSYVMAENGIDTGGTIAVAGLRDWGIANGNYITRDKVTTENVKPGDIVIWKDASHSHTGIVTSVNSDGSFDTIEGNTWGNGNRNDRVMEKHYNSIKNPTGFISIG